MSTGTTSGDLGETFILRCIRAAEKVRPILNTTLDDASGQFSSAVMHAYDGSAVAQLCLAQYYLLGHGIAPDLISARAWALVSAQNGNPDAVTLINELTLDPEDEAEALKRANDISAAIRTGTSLIATRTV